MKVRVERDNRECRERESKVRGRSGEQEEEEGENGGLRRKKCVGDGEQKRSKVGSEI